MHHYYLFCLAAICIPLLNIIRHVVSYETDFPLSVVVVNILVTITAGYLSLMFACKLEANARLREKHGEENPRKATWRILRLLAVVVVALITIEPTVETVHAVIRLDVILYIYHNATVLMRMLLVLLITLPAIDPPARIEASEQIHS